MLGTPGRYFAEQMAFVEYKDAAIAAESGFKLVQGVNANEVDLREPHSFESWNVRLPGPEGRQGSSNNQGLTEVPKRYGLHHDFGSQSFT